MSMNINVEKILETFGEQKRIFQREAQFQFELAWEIQKQIDNNGEKAKVYLEFLSCTKNKPKTKRFYSDIVIIDENRNYIVIELKYKTKKAYFTNGNGEQITLFNHGASDEGRYDYLLDIHRIELLKNKCTNTIEYEYSEHLQTFEKGYAILLTNEKQYWERKKRDAEKINAVDKYFSIGDGDEIEHEIHWNATQQKNWMKSRKGFLLTGDYICNWKNYCTDSSYKNAKTFKEFKYLITEIK